MRLLARLVIGAFILSSSAWAQTQGDPSAWRNDPPSQPDSLLVRNATVWTQGPAGKLTGVDLLVRNGTVAAVGPDLEPPVGAIVIDATDKHVTPGLIDAHSHTAVLGAVNEGTHISTAEVRIEDVIDADEINLYRQLAGGVTASNQLHGSANAIGGQSAVIKHRWGATPRELLLDGAPPGIKFALGENPKQSNWNLDERRYPQTRSGVEQIIRERFEAAREYRAAIERQHAGGGKGHPTPRPDFELEALVEILEGERLVHSHAYRADEMLMLMAVAEDFGFAVGTFEHALEGYKVAAELAAHGAGASTFSDWWAYKYEVVDAIPYNGAIMWDRDVVVSFNSDSSELARRLNLEAAKAVRYGGVPEVEAMAFVTINPARQLGIDQRVGSLEPGKDADFVLWSGHPFSTATIAEQTWVDGRKYFDRADDLARREAVAAERNALLAKAGNQGKKEDDEGPPDDPEAPEPETGGTS